jgi:hypothetical protein
MNEIILNRDYSQLSDGDTFKYNNERWIVQWNRRDNYTLGALSEGDAARCPKTNLSTIFMWKPKGSNHE